MRVTEKIAKTLINGLSGLAVTSWGTMAVYQSWAERESVFPYIVLTWTFREGIHWGRRDGTLIIDIFTKGNSIIEAEGIRNDIVELLDRQIFDTDEGGRVRCYFDNDGIIPDENPEVCHLSMDFTVRFWRKWFIEKL